ncbi:MAG TPA: hypothetical protein VH228_07655 [Nocardioides sp.]|nr:hypothetical protein [Nocardioides sp.]
MSLPRSGDGLARRALATATEDGHDVGLRQGAYDVDEVVADLSRVGRPVAASITRKPGRST